MVKKLRPDGTAALNMNIDEKLLEQLDKYRFAQQFTTRSRAIQFLLRKALALKFKPEDSER